MLTIPKALHWQGFWRYGAWGALWIYFDFLKAFLYKRTLGNRDAILVRHNLTMPAARVPAERACPTRGYYNYGGKKGEADDR